MNLFIMGKEDADTVLLQMVDEHDREGLDEEFGLINEACPDKNIKLVAVMAESWNDDLSPWPAEPVFGNEPFGGRAADMLKYLQDSVIPQNTQLGQTLYIGGYSLAGLFALWAVYNTEIFAGAACASPSVWFPGFTEYMQDNKPHTGAVYLSLGTKEEKTKNPVMATVGDAIRAAHIRLDEQDIKNTLEWNEGNHFKDPQIRMANAFIWLIKNS